MFLFGRRSLVVRVLECVGIILSVVILRDLLARDFWHASTYCYAAAIIQYFFVVFCHLFPWYREQRKKYPAPKGDLGIEVHFLKSLVPSSYIICLGSLLFLAGYELLASIIMTLLLIPLSTINAVLVSFHLKDKEEMPVNYFTHNWHLKEKTSE